MLANGRGEGFRRRALSMTSLIDVIFLLLLFFMLSSTFSKFSEVELLSAGAGQSEASAQAPVFVRLEPENLSLNGHPHGLEDLLAGLEAMLGNASDGTGEQSGDQFGDQLVLVSLDDAVSSQRLVDLLAVLRGVTGIRVMVLGGG